MADIKVTLADIRAVGKSAATLHAVRRLVHRLFAVAVEEDRVPGNPVSGVETEKVEPREPRFLTQEEVRRIAGEVSGPIPGARALSRLRRPANR
jgi:site-specific recombinase XerD